MKRKIKITMLVFTLALLFLPLVSAADIIEPHNNRTFPHSTNIPAYVDTSMHSWTSVNCWYNLYWYGDNSSHPDEYLPPYQYNNISISCDDLENGDGLFNVEFDGEYRFEVWIEGNDTSYRNWWSDFYVDRSEISGSKILAAMFLPIIMLGITFFIFLIGVKLDEGEHLPLKFMFTFLPILLFPLIIYTAKAVLYEYIKMPVLNNLSQILFFVTLFGILVLFLFYWAYYLTKKTMEKLKEIRGLKIDDE